MKAIGKTRTEQILRVMYVLSWIAFIGLLVKTGAIMISFSVSLYNPEASHNLYKGLSLHEVREHSFWYYTQVVSLMIVFSGLKAYIFYLVIKALSKVNLTNPFTMDVAILLEKISYVLIGIWAVALMYNAQTEWFAKRQIINLEQWSTDGFFLMAGLVFIISQIFKRGVEIQAENELTV
ncbi:DUF2975 domain-containing protein [Pontibacter sp. HSC-14F20]|uniref:DUF2975 domain-containing protein n=1 Tax=Pontibacter sp. HSC-14F20 TaxID=2864136 RepID=UPI001C730432|nr:DUF2975 domain-containing protein [Pontibacter sp. HSC-14F20]MBX0332408.1 DUF2975 domain-containing protein [Pontibacter sp. HSC-14F20]